MNIENIYVLVTYENIVIRFSHSIIIYTCIHIYVFICGFPSVSYVLELNFFLLRSIYFITLHKWLETRSQIFNWTTDVWDSLIHSPRPVS